MTANPPAAPAMDAQVLAGELRDRIAGEDGYSCREQIVQSTGREVLHLAEVLARALPKKGASP
jgi:hypothetical protein